nr:hypothetical protein [uncultured Sphaerochaeta sp.]
MPAGIISYQTKNGIRYARFCIARYKDGKKFNEESSLGRVIDEEKGIFKNRERGVFTFLQKKAMAQHLIKFAMEPTIKVNAGTSLTSVTASCSIHFGRHPILECPGQRDAGGRPRCLSRVSWVLHPGRGGKIPCEDLMGRQLCQRPFSKRKVGRSTDK